jgi:hypothetical protein
MRRRTSKLSWRGIRPRCGRYVDDSISSLNI